MGRTNKKKLLIQWIKIQLVTRSQYTKKYMTAEELYDIYSLDKESSVIKDVLSFSRLINKIVKDDHCNYLKMCLLIDEDLSKRKEFMIINILMTIKNQITEKYHQN